MNGKTLVDNIFKVISEQQSEIKNAKADKSLVDPIDADVIKTLKAMGYEKIMEECIAYKRSN